MARASADYQAAFTLGPTECCRALVQVFVWQAARDADAVLADCDRHLRANPDDFLSLGRRAYTLLLLGRDEEAQRDLDRRLSLDPGGRPLVEAVVHAIRQRRGAAPGRRA